MKEITLADFRVNVFNLIMDRIVQSLELRFVQHKQLYKDLSSLDPAKFKTTAEKGLEDEALEGNLYYEVVSTNQQRSSKIGIVFFCFKL
jgi:hypothetical protein